jgi:hypothetical protein
MGSEQAHPEPLLRFIARFDRRQYWLAHEELEELWLQDRQDFFKGLIQLAAAFVHIERDNWRGALRLLRTGLEYMEGAPARLHGFDVEGVRRRARAARQRVAELAAGDRGGFDAALFFEFAPLFAGAVRDDLVDDEPLPYRVRRYEEGYRAVRGRSEE